MTKKREVEAPKNEIALSIVDSWANTLAMPEIGNVLTDFAEIGLDSVLQEGIIKDIPFVSDVISLYKIGATLRERSYLRKLALFIKDINDGNVDENKRQRYIDRITKNKRTIQQELEYVMTLLDRILSEQKAKYLGRLFLAYMYEEIDWPLFCQLSELIDRLLPGDIECMSGSVLGNIHRSEIEDCTLQRLQGLGIVTPNTNAGVFDINGNALSSKPDGTYRLTALGRKLSDCIL